MSADEAILLLVGLAVGGAVVNALWLWALNRQLRHRQEERK